jgi:hypothetical protein
MADTYKIVRMYADPNKHSRTIAKGLTLAGAQAHCADPETSSKTAVGRKAKAITRRNGPWFDGYDAE